MNKKEMKRTHKDGRRKVLKSIAAGSAISLALPDKWRKPIVNAVALPAHAEGSEEPTTTVAPTTTMEPTTTPVQTLEYFLSGGDLVGQLNGVSEEHWLSGVLDTIIPTALAQERGPSAICVTVTGTNADIHLRNGSNLLGFQGSGPADGSNISLANTENCGEDAGSRTVRIVGYNPGDDPLMLELDSGRSSTTQMFSIPQVPCNIGPLADCPEPTTTVPPTTTGTTTTTTTPAPTTTGTTTTTTTPAPTTPEPTTTEQGPA